MSTTCNSLNVQLIKVSRLSKYSNLMPNDFILTIQSSSYNGITTLYSRRTTFSNILKFFSVITASYLGSFSGSFKGRMSGSLSGSFYGSVKSKNISASGSLSGSFYGSVRSKNISSSGSLSGSYFGSVRSKNLNATGSLSGSFYGSVRSKNISASGSLSGSYFGSIKSKNTSVSGSLSGSYFGRIKSKNLIATGSLSGSFRGKLIGITGTENINNVTIGANTPSTIKGTTITATDKFIGDLKGDILSQTGIKVLENGAGGVSGAYFYGTSSYSLKSVVVNGVPNGGNNTFALTKVNGNDYNVQWSNIKKLFVTPSSVTSSINSNITSSVGSNLNSFVPVFIGSGTKTHRIFDYNGAFIIADEKPNDYNDLSEVNWNMSAAIFANLFIQGDFICNSVPQFYQMYEAQGTIQGGYHHMSYLTWVYIASRGANTEFYPLTIRGGFSPETNIINIPANSGITTITIGSNPVTKLILSKSLTLVRVNLNFDTDVKIYIQTCSNATAVTAGGSSGPFTIKGWSGSLQNVYDRKINWDAIVGIPTSSLQNTHTHISHRYTGGINVNGGYFYYMGTFKKYSRL